MKKESKKYGLEKFEVAKLKNENYFYGGTSNPITLKDNDTDNPIKPVTTI
ncbi:hypothetical protein [Flavobacterium sp.]